MKRTEVIALSAVGVLLVASFWPRGEPVDETPTEAQAFATIEECRDSNTMPEADCAARFWEARDQHVAAAQKFEGNAECETEYGAGNCRPATWNGAGVFVPALAGFLAGRAMSRAQPLYPASARAQACPPGANSALRPDCAPATSGSSSSSSGTSSSGSSSSGGRSGRYFLTAAGNTIFRGAGQMNVQAPRSALSSAPTRNSIASPSGTVSRGGFGSTGRGFSSSS